jgi:hypothetical protein
MLVVAILTAAKLSTRLNGDIQYVLGGLSAAGDIGWVDTFVHRPLPYRLFMSVLNVAAGAVGLRTVDFVPYETVIHVIGIVIALASGALLWRALLPRLGRTTAAAVGAATALALILAPSHDYLQAEWVATLLAVVALSAAMLPRRAAAAAALAGLCLVAVAGVKVSTVFLVPAVLIVLAYLDRRRVGPVLLGTAGWAVAYAVVLILLPLERQWTFDSAALSALSRDESLRSALAAISEKAMVTPVILLVPCALALALAALGGSMRRRVLLVAGFVVTSLLLIGPSVAQGTWQVYHLAPLPVAATAFVAGVGAWWWTTRRQQPWPILVGIPVAAVLATAFLSQDLPTRTALVGEARGVALALTIVTGAWGVALTWPGRAPGSTIRTPHPLTFGLALVALLAFLPAQAPDTAWDVGRDRTNASWNAQSTAMHAGLRRLTSEIGDDGPVLYVAFGTAPYHMGIPTTCRYPSPLWVQRGTVYRSLRELWSYSDNLACFDAHLAAYVVIETGWAMPGRLTGDMQRGLSGFDCNAGRSLNGMLSCPSRYRAEEPGGGRYGAGAIASRSYGTKSYIRS